MRHPLKLIVAAGTALVLATLVGGTALLLERGERVARAGAEASLARAGQAVENTLNRQLLQVDGALASLPALLAAMSPEVAMQPAGVARLLRSLNFQAYAFRDLMLVGPDGSILASARPEGGARPVQLDLSDLHGRRGAGMSGVVGPIRNVATGDWSLYLVRPIALGGRRDTLAVAEVPLPTLLKLVSEAGLETGMRVRLERPDSRLLASLPHDELQVGKLQMPAMNRLSRDGRPFDVPDLVMQPPTLAVVRPSLYEDVVVAVTIERRIAFAEWSRSRDWTLVSAESAAALILAFAYALLVALRQRERLETERARAGAVLENAIEAMSDGFVMWDEADRLVTCNRRYRELYAVSADLFQPGALFEDIIRGGIAAGQYPEAAGREEAFVADIVKWHRSGRGAIERLLPGGRWLLITERCMENGGIVGIRTDITAMKSALRDLTERDLALHRQNARFEAALDNMSQGLLMVDAEENLIVHNSRFLSLFDLGRTEAIRGGAMAQMFDTVAAHRSAAARGFRAIQTHQQALAAREASGSFIVITPDDRAISVCQQPLAEGGWVATYEDVTERRASEDRINFLAHHDDLTKLPNRVLFHHRLAEVLHAARAEGTGMALLYLDLDRFKDVNDTLGHPIGDALLKEVAARLRDGVDERDLVARLGGDEFAVIHLARDLPGDAEALSARLIAAIGRPYDIRGRRVDVGVSIGIAVASDLDGDLLLKNADLALYEAKTRGRGTFSVFEPDMSRRLEARIDMESDLRHALDRGEFEMAYQPIYDLRRDRVCGFEALIRWRHPVRGSVSPGEFVPLAEETGLIVEIGAWVLERACRDIAPLPDDLKIAVNLSPVQLGCGDIVGTVAAALHLSGLAPGRLELEITETALVQNQHSTAERLHALRALGLDIVLDDFGTGYSSLSHLRSFPLAKIKIDQSFVREMATRADSAAIVTSVVSLAEKLGMTTTAEGVETAEQLDLVRRAGCAQAQGYLLGRPQPILRAVEDLMSRRTPPLREAPEAGDLGRTG